MIRYIIIAAAMWTTSCGASSLELHSRAAIASETVIAEAQRSIRAARSAEVARAIDAAPDRESALAARDAIDLRFAPVVDVYEGVRAAHMLWVRLILQASEGRPFDVVAAVGFAHDLVVMWAELRTLAGHVGLTLPDIAALTNAATDAAEGT